ncbi:hypothetical protein PQX77_003526, partial [Marasmius sp. AFHP31]
DAFEHPDCVSDTAEVEEPDGTTSLRVVEKPERSGTIEEVVRELDKYRSLQNNIKQGRAKGVCRYTGITQKRLARVRDMTRKVPAEVIWLPPAGVAPIDYFGVTQFNAFPAARRALYAPNRFAAFPLEFSGRTIVHSDHEFKSMRKGLFALKYGKEVLQQYHFPSKAEVKAMQREDEESEAAEQRRQRAAKAARLQAKIFGKGRGRDDDNDSDEEDKDEDADHGETSRLCLKRLERRLDPTHLRNRGRDVLHFVDIDKAYEWLQYPNGEIIRQGMLHSIPYTIDGDEVVFKSSFAEVGFATPGRAGRRDVKGPFGLQAQLVGQSCYVHLYYYADPVEGLEWYEDADDKVWMCGKRGAWRVELVNTKRSVMMANIVGYYGNKRDGDEDVNMAPPDSPNANATGTGAPLGPANANADKGKGKADDQPVLMHEVKGKDDELISSVTRYKIDEPPFGLEIWVGWKNGYELHAAGKEVWYEGPIGSIPHKIEGAKLSMIDKYQYIWEEGLLIGYQLDLNTKEEIWYDAETEDTVRHGKWGTVKVDLTNRQYNEENESPIIRFLDNSPASPTSSPRPEPHSSSSSPPGPHSSGSSRMQEMFYLWKPEFNRKELFLTTAEGHEWWYELNGQLFCEGPVGLVEWHIPTPMTVIFTNMQQNAPSNHTPPLRELTAAEQKADAAIEVIRKDWSGRDGWPWNVSRATSDGKIFWMLWCDEKNEEIWFNESGEKLRWGYRLTTFDFVTPDQRIYAPAHFPPAEMTWQFDLPNVEGMCTQVVRAAGEERWIDADGKIIFASSRICDECFWFVKKGVLALRSLPQEFVPAQSVGSAAGGGHDDAPGGHGGDRGVWRDSATSAASQRSTVSSKRKSEASIDSQVSKCHCSVSVSSDMSTALRRILLFLYDSPPTLSSPKITLKITYSAYNAITSTRLYTLSLLALAVVMPSKSLPSVFNKVPTSVTSAPLYTAVDGRVGAWVEDGIYFVTSPNTEDIYMPLFGPREVYFCQDYRLGPEDPLLYPQPFLQDQCHWAAIPRRPSNSEHSRAKWWHELPPEAFVNEQDSAVTGLGRWDRDTYLCMRKIANIYTSVSKRILERTYRHLTTMPLPLHCACLLWSFFQHWFLELLGALDWVEVYQLIMEGRCPPSESSSNSAGVTIGAFLTSVRDCEHFFKAGLPFWLVRSAEHHPTCQVDKEVPLITPQLMQICVDDIMSHKKDVIYHGPLRDLRKATAIEKFGLAIIDYSNDSFTVPAADPFAEAPSASSSQPLNPSSSAGPSRTKKKKKLRHEPYKTEAKSKSSSQPQPQVEQDKFVEIRGLYSPDIPDVWVEARSSIDRSRQPGQNEVVNRGYAFPDLGYVLHVSPEKMRRVLETWVRLYPVLTFCYCMPSCLALSAWSPKQWRILLGTTEDHVAKEGSQMAERRSAVKDLLGQCLDFYGLKLEDTQKSLLLTWRDGQYGVGQLSEPQLVKRMVWELFELNFRFEFHSLDRKLRGVTDDLSFNEEIQVSFPGCEGIGSPTQIDSKKANCGLAAELPKHRAWYFIRMCRVMKDWPGGVQAETFLAGKQKLKDYPNDELLAMEQWATTFYCQSFYEKFGRPPILPHRVDPF